MRQAGGVDPTRGHPRRPTLRDTVSLAGLGGSVDPIQHVEAAHASAALLVTAGRTTDDPETTARLVALVEELGLSTVADLWADRPARSLPGALWRLYALREWVVRAPLEASREYSAGRRHTQPNHVVAGPAEPTGPDQLIELADAILTGVFRGDLAVALERAAAFCRVVAAGRADSSEGPDAAERAASLLATAHDLAACAALWRHGNLT